MQSSSGKDGGPLLCHDRAVCDCGCAEQVAARDAFIGVLGHELRNSIAPLVLLTDHFEHLRSTDPALEARVGMLARNLKKLTSTIDRISEVSALRDGTIVLDWELVDLRDVVDDVARELADDAARAGAEVRIRYSRAVQGWWDRARLKQLVSNLVINSIRYGDGAPIDISLQMHGTKAELVIADSGPGIPPASRAHLFDRLDHVAPRGNGFGVGLFVVKALCHAMGGTVRLDDAKTGARFNVTLPRG